MKFRIIFDGTGRKVIEITPEAAGEAQLLASLAPDNGAREAEEPAKVLFEWTSDRPPYKKVTSVQVVL